MKGEGERVTVVRIWNEEIRSMAVNEWDMIEKGKKGIKGFRKLDNVK